jgi:DNA polymerase-1
VAKRPVLHLIDGSAQLHRAYFAIRTLTSAKGFPTGAVYGFTTMLRKLLQDEKPQFLGIAFDVAAKTFRHEQYKDYKATRRKMEDDLAVQLPFVRRVCDAYRVPRLELSGFEADDVIATLSRQALEKGYDVVVVTGDKDFLQMVNDRVLVLNPGREGSGSILYDAKTVEEKFGVPPERVVDVLALVGDAVDNVPGVAGIGEKGARDLVREYGPLEAILENAEKIKRAAYREGLLRDRENAILSKDLVTLRTDVPIELDVESLRLKEPDKGAAWALFTELEFVTLAREYAPEPTATKTVQEVVTEPAAVARLAAEIRKAGKVAVSLVRSHREPLRGELLGLALAHQPGYASYLPLASGTRQLSLGGEATAQGALAALRPLLEDAAVAKVSARGKTDRLLLQEQGVEARGLTFDALVAAYLLDPGRRAFTLEEMARDFLEERPRALSETLNGGALHVSPEEVAAAASQEADLVLRLAEPVSAKLAAEGLEEIYRTMELPLIEVLADMEAAGVKVDVALLSEMSKEMDARLAVLTGEIHELAGTTFNINSPHQLRQVLFERLELKSGKKTAKTRAQSTEQEELERLAEEHDIAKRILDYRSLQKLKGTYVDALPALINPRTGRIHASLNQTVAATGRISSSDPNLQNIPIRTAEGRRIREAFVAEPGHLLLSADYSQIELRILAHMSQDPILIDTFRRGEDIHDRTSREVFGPISPIPPDEQRRISKMINYALLYGKTAFTLAKDIDVSRGEAKEFIDRYFARYPSVKAFIDATIEKARKDGRVRTLLGRLRLLPELNARNPQIRAEAERQAMNTPVQGSAADLIKKAMIDLHRELRVRKLRSRLILQIHDELLLEVPEAEAETARALVKEVMEGALSLDVPLLVDARVGRSWADVH